MKRKKMRPVRVWTLVGISDGHCYFGVCRTTKRLCADDMKGRKLWQPCRVAQVEIREVTKKRKARKVKK